MQLQDIRSRVLLRIGLDSDDPTFTSANLDDIINDALRQVSTDRDWPWLETRGTLAVVAGTQSYSLPSAWTGTVRMWDNSHIIEHREPRDMVEYEGLTGDPFFFTIEGSQIYLYPIPTTSDTFGHTYYVEETELTTDTQEPAIPDRYIDYLVVTAGVLCAERLRNQELFSMMQVERAAWIERIADNIRSSKASARIRTRKDSL